MFDDIPSRTATRPADNEDEGWRYVQGDKNARRPPELLTRDHVARCIMREVKAGRGSPHGGVFLDIAWIKTKVSGGAEHIKRKLPSMYHQFKELATSTSPASRWKSARRRTTSWAASASTATRRCRRFPASSRRRVRGRHQNGANRLGGNSLSDLLVFGKRAGSTRRNSPPRTSACRSSRAARSGRPTRP
jgi:succinate dehydrogenase / fumarate reductase flavoprotein subunit